MPLSNLLEVKNEQEQQEILDAAFKKQHGKEELELFYKVIDCLGDKAQEIIKLFYDIAFIDGVLWSKKRLDQVEQVYNNYEQN